MYVHDQIFLGFGVVITLSLTLNRIFTGSGDEVDVIYVLCSVGINNRS